MKKWIAGLILFFSVVLFTISLYFLMGMFRQEMQASHTYGRLQEFYNSQASEKNKGRDGAETVGSEEEQEQREINAGLLALNEENPDCIGWITIEGTAIDYPVMYRPQDKDYYLHRDFYGNYLPAGSLYLSEICDPDAADNLIIYGHHMKSGTMFAALDKYKSRDFYEDHRLIRYSTLHGEEYYRVFAAFSVPVYTGNDFQYYDFAEAESETEYESFVAACKEKSYYETRETAVYGEKLLTLSTCEYSHKNGRMVVVAKRMEGGEANGWN